MRDLTAVSNGAQIHSYLGWSLFSTPCWVYPKGWGVLHLCSGGERNTAVQNTWKLFIATRRNHDGGFCWVLLQHLFPTSFFLSKPICLKSLRLADTHFPRLPCGWVMAISPWATWGGGFCIASGKGDTPWLKRICNEELLFMPCLRHGRIRVWGLELGQPFCNHEETSWRLLKSSILMVKKDRKSFTF